MRNPADYVSQRARAIDASGIRKVFDLAAKMKDPINLSIGLPDFDVPEAVKSAAIDAIKSGHNRYTQTQGIAPLRQRLGADLSREFSRDAGEVLITSGVSGGLLLAILAMIDPGDEVIFLDPYFVMYKHLVVMAGGTPVIIDSYPDFRFPASRVEKAITKRTKLLMLNSPSNPTGVTLSESEIRQAVEIAKKHDLLLLSDEIYKTFLYDGAGKGVYSAAEIYDRTLVLRGFSKSHAMTGWRLGYATGPAEIISQMTKLQQYTFVCPPSPLQYAALTAIDVPMDKAVESYRRKRDIAMSVLPKKFQVQKPDGAFYIFPRVPDGTTATDFCTRAIEN
ncbi:MAG: pyridoxal phosphate-dependent aminotransferase, partial [Tepidisphaeraceae bacterium]